MNRASNSKSVETFKALSKRLALPEELVSLKPARKTKQVFSSVQLVKTSQKTRIQIKEPITFSSVLKSSKLLNHIQDENFREDQANALLEKVAETDVFTNDEQIDWQKAMDVIEKVESLVPSERKNLELLANKPGIRPTFNLASVANEMTTLQRLVDLGVKVGNWEQNGHIEQAFTIDFKLDVVPRIHFLMDNDIKADQLGHILTENPQLFQQDMDQLQTRVKYLKYQNFTKLQIRNVILKSDSKWLNHAADDIDARLGFVSKLFQLQPTFTSSVASSCPNLIIWKGTPNQLENNHLVVTDLMGFEKKETQRMLLKCPQLFMEKDTDTIQDKFDVLHNEIGYSHELLAHFPQALTGDLVTTKTRLRLLQKLKKDRFDPNKPGYVNPKTLVLSSDEDFSANVAKIPLDLYNKFMLTV